MPDQPPSRPDVAVQVQASLHELAKILREARHLDPEAQRALADLVDELGKMLDPARPPSVETAQLAGSAANLMRALHEKQNPTLLQAAKDRLEEAALRAEAEAPLATGIVERLIDALANIGI
jgi:hypothetical protein